MQFNRAPMPLKLAIERWKPRVGFDELVVEVNKIYHAFEAGDYDRTHPEVFEQLPPRWQEMIHRALQTLPPAPIHILDYGCGTGFAAQQALTHIPRDRVGSLVCYDPSQEMLEYCRRKIAPLYPHARFVHDISHIPRNHRFNLLLTNSLLHHLPHPLTAIESLMQQLDDRCIWCSGHEPSRRFYQNQACVRLLNSYARWKKLASLLQPARLLHALRRRIWFDDRITALTAHEAHKRNLFAVKPNPRTIRLLVDYHVAHSPAEVDEGRGFCLRTMAEALESTWHLQWHETYSFLGPFCELRASKRWKTKAARLAARFPDDGACFCAVWTRQPASIDLSFRLRQDSRERFRIAGERKTVST